jgi:hypothetical protein
MSSASSLLHGPGAKLPDLLATFANCEKALVSG